MVSVPMKDSHIMGMVFLFGILMISSVEATSSTLTMTEVTTWDSGKINLPENPSPQFWEKMRTWKTAAEELLIAVQGILRVNEKVGCEKIIQACSFANTSWKTLSDLIENNGYIKDETRDMKLNFCLFSGGIPGFVIRAKVDGKVLTENWFDQTRKACGYSSEVQEAMQKAQRTFDEYVNSNFYKGTFDSNIKALRKKMKDPRSKLPGYRIPAMISVEGLKIIIQRIELALSHEIKILGAELNINYFM